jgi:nicotinate-nucleotide--dimethylbenzimidazole phosphoribosyltransferase
VIVLLLGGARSGKSELAERFASATGADVTYLATAVVDEDDADFVRRVAEHRARRPSTWKTVEAGDDLPARLRTATGTALVESLGTWVARHEACVVDVTSIVDAITSRAGTTILVSEEVGLGVHPSTEAGRVFRDALGSLNHAVAAIADEVLLVVAGRVLPLERMRAGRSPTEEGGGVVRER